MIVAAVAAVFVLAAIVLLGRKRVAAAPLLQLPLHPALVQFWDKPTRRRYAVVGGGFVGGRIAMALLARGETDVLVVDVVRNPSLPEGAKFAKGSVTDFSAMASLLTGCDVVFYTAAAIRYWETQPHQLPLSHAVNVVGTRNVIDACVRAKVAVLVATSTSNVCLSPRGCFGGDEALPYAAAPLNHYVRTKIAAERIVLRANGAKLRTACARPCSGIFGVGDSFLVDPALSGRVRGGGGKLTTQAVMLNGRTVIDYVFVDNVVHGHLLLERALLEGDPNVCGGAFNFNNGTPCSGEHLYNVLSKFFNFKYDTLPRPLACALAWLSYACQFVFKGRVSLGDVDKVTPATLALVDTPYTFSSEKARQQLSYAPLVSLQGALEYIGQFVKSHR